MGFSTTKYQANVAGGRVIKGASTKTTLRNVGVLPVFVQWYGGATADGGLDTSYAGSYNGWPLLPGEVFTFETTSLVCTISDDNFYDAPVLWAIKD